MKKLSKLSGRYFQDECGNHLVLVGDQVIKPSDMKCVKWFRKKAANIRKTHGNKALESFLMSLIEIASKA